MMRNITAFFTALLVTFTLTSASLAQEELQEKQQEQTLDKKAVEKIVKDYLLENPEIILQAYAVYQQRQKQAMAAQVVSQYKGYLYNETHGSSIGNPEADVTIVEFFDYRCGYCKRSFPNVKRLVEEDKNIRVVFKHYPILDSNDKSTHSTDAAYGAIAAEKQGKFIEYHSRLMQSSGKVTADKVQEIARVIGLDMQQFNEDLKAPVNKKIIMNAMYFGEQLELSGTPGYLIGKTLVEGAPSYEAMKELVANERAKLKEAAAATSAP